MAVVLGDDTARFLFANLFIDWFNIFMQVDIMSGNTLILISDGLKITYPDTKST